MVWRDNIPLAAEPITSLPYVGGKIARLLSMKRRWDSKPTGTGPAVGIRYGNLPPWEWMALCWGRPCFLAIFEKHMVEDIRIWYNKEVR